MSFIPPVYAYQIPNAPIHPLRDLLQFPYTAAELLEKGAALLEAFLKNALLALSGIFIPGTSSFNQLQGWAHGIVDSISVQEGNWATWLDGLLGTGHTVHDGVVYVQGIFSNAYNAISTLNSMAIGLIGTSNYTAMITAMQNTQTNAFNSWNAIEAAVTSLTGGTAVSLATALTTIPGNFISSALSQGVIPTLTSSWSGTIAGSLLTGSVAAGLVTGALTNVTSATISGTLTLGGALTGAGTVAASMLTGTIAAGVSMGASQLTGALNTALTLGGTSLSTLFPSGQIAASQLAGALNTGVTIAGNAISALFNSSGVIGSAVSGALSNATLAVGALTGLASGIGAWLAAGGALPSGISIGYAAVVGLASYITSNLQGWINAGITIGSSAVTGLSSAIASTVAGLSLNAANLVGSLPGAILTAIYNYIKSLFPSLPPINIPGVGVTTDPLVTITNIVTGSLGPNGLISLVPHLWF